MKKLTAGILTVMLGIVAANSADASIASRGYVDAQVKTKVSTSDFTTFQETNTAAIEAAKKAGTDASNALGAYKTEASNTFATKTELSEGLGNKQNTLTAADFVKDGTGNVVTGVTVGTDGKIKYTTASVTTSEDFGKLQTTVGEHTSALNTLNGGADTTGSVANSIAKAITDMETKTDAANTYATKTALEDVDGKFADYTTTTDMNAKLDTKADKTTIGTVTEGKTVVQMIEEAKSTASGATSTLAGRVDTIEQSAAYKSGITAEKVTQIETNKTDIATNKTAVEAVTNDLATNYTKTSALSALAKADIPATCTDPNAANGCALILKNGVYSWEVVERDASEKNN